MESVKCMICSNPMNTSEPLVSTKCHHTFHQNCMSKYIETTPFCPTCKNSVNNSSLIQFTLPSGSSTPQGAIPKRITRKTRPSNRNVQVNENVNVSSLEQLLENRTVVENLNQNEFTKLYEIIEKLSQKLERLEMNVNSEPQFPRELFPPTTYRTSIASNPP
ncbi:E3 ubiquitin-protein ligase TRAIP-like [Calliphora vicina]|uniref:E3 ubiquitin-protein ligase TRAIP-like n=1 Tax=Calliphora vicina TaxID=7373 RepID=UPI00325A452C